MDERRRTIATTTTIPLTPPPVVVVRKAKPHTVYTVAIVTGDGGEPRGIEAFAPPPFPPPRLARIEVRMITAALYIHALYTHLYYTPNRCPSRTPSFGKTPRIHKIHSLYTLYAQTIGRNESRFSDFMDVTICFVRERVGASRYILWYRIVDIMQYVAVSQQNRYVTVNLHT